MAFKFEYPNLAIVVPVLNEVGTITRLLSSLNGQQKFGGQKVQHILVNNGSKPGTLEEIDAWRVGNTSFPLTILDEPNAGVGFARDRGFLHAINNDAEVVLGIDADCVPDRRWAMNVTTIFNDSTVQLFGGKVVAWHDSDYKLGDTARLRLMRLAKRALFGTLVLGNNMAIRSTAYRAKGEIIPEPKKTPDTTVPIETTSTSDDVTDSVATDAFESIGARFRAAYTDGVDFDRLLTRLFIDKYGESGVYIENQSGRAVVAADMRLHRKLGFIGMVQREIFGSSSGVRTAKIRSNKRY